MSQFTRGHLWLFAIAACARAAFAADSPAPRPNVLFLFSDDQRADTIGALGNQDVRTPNLDRLVRAGTTFTRAYCMGALQGAVCVPSRAMLLTGRTLFRIHPQMENQTTWPEKFAEAGYTTFITGKWHNGPASVVRAFSAGKAVFLGGMSPPDPTAMTVHDFSAERELIKQRPAGKLPSELFADCAIEFLRDRKADSKPFLAYVAFNLPHDPKIAPPEYHARAHARKPPLPPNFLAQHPFHNGDLTGRDERLAPWPRTPEIIRQHLADYHASIEFLDAQIARILAALRESDLEEKTIIVFASDHGLAIGSHGLMGKQNLYDHSMRAPLILVGPGIPRDARSDAMCYLFDVFPTLGALAAVPPPEGSDGENLAPHFAAAPPKGRPAIFTAYAKVQRAIRDERWKLIVYPQINHTQLFDLRDDPAERTDLAAHSEHRPQVGRLTALLGAAQRKLGDQLPLSSPTPLPFEFDFSKVKPAVEK